MVGFEGRYLEGVMESAIALIYGDDVLDDLDFCSRNNAAILQYSHGIMTLQGAPLATLESIAKEPLSVPGFKHSLLENPDHRGILQEFFTRLIRYYRMNRSGHR